FHFFFSSPPRPPPSTLFPYTTLFRSWEVLRRSAVARGGNGAWDRPCIRGRRRGAVPAAVKASGQRPEDDRSDERRSTGRRRPRTDRKSTRLNSSHVSISYAVFCLKKK